MPPGQPLPRNAAAADLGAIHAIYAHHVPNGLASFEEVPPRARKCTGASTILGRGLPFLALELDGEVAGSLLRLYRARSAYRYALEDSVYVRPDLVGRGVGRSWAS